MDTAQMTECIFLFLTAAGLLAVSRMQFRETGFLLNNAYISASKEQKKQMDEHPESKRPHYRQSGWVFLLLGLSFLILGACIAVPHRWMLKAFRIMLAVTLIYAVVSSVKSVRH